MSSSNSTCFCTSSCSCSELSSDTTAPWDVLVPLDIYTPFVHKAILPALARGVLGSDEDCMELVTKLATSGIAGVATDEDRCAHCRASDKPCISAAQHAHAWAWPATYATSRCISCVLAGVPCDLPWRTFTCVCMCEWLLPPADRAMVDKYVALSRLKMAETCKPRAQRASFAGQELLGHLSKWVGKKLAEGIVYEPRRDLLDVMRQTLGREPYRDDGRWLIEALDKWTPCVCTPYECDPDQHLRYMYLMNHASDDDDEKGQEDESESEDTDSTDDTSDVLASASASDERSDLGYDAQDEDSPNNSHTPNSHTIVNESDVSLVVARPRVAEGRCCGVF